MKKIQKLRICDWSLLPLTAAILVSGIQLESTGSVGLSDVWIHIALGILFVSFIGWHVWLHFGAANWFTRFHKVKSPVTRILWWVTLLMLLTAVIATACWLRTFTHSGIGGVHGKLGFLMIILAIAHTLKRLKFYRRK